ncbi:MAG: DUF1016 family protein [Anaerolineales bacterium]|nr:DUF1016 family protein [Anaerolineales bacterium]
MYNPSEVGLSNSNSNHKPVGIRYRTEAGEVDILCLDTRNNFVVIELKRNKAPDRVVAQVDRYIAWVEKNLAQPGQRVRGLIIAKSFDKRLKFTLIQRRNIDFWIYDYQLRFDKKAIRKKVGSRSTTSSEANLDEDSLTFDTEVSYDTPGENPSP